MFHSRALDYLASDSGSPKQCQVWDTSHGVGHKYNQILFGYSHKVLWHHCPGIYCRQETIVTLEICG